MLECWFCVFGCVCVCLTALPLMSWVWRRDGFSGRRLAVLVWEHVNDQTWSKLPWLRHFLLSQLILKRNITNVLTLKWGIPHSEYHEITDARMCVELTKIVSVKRVYTAASLYCFGLGRQWRRTDDVMQHLNKAYKLSRLQEALILDEERYRTFSQNNSRDSILIILWGRNACWECTTYKYVAY